MPDFSLRARPPAGPLGNAGLTHDPDVLASFLEDAAHFSGGHARELVAPATEAELARALRSSRTVLPIGAQSSLTGGATPMGETIVSTRRLTGSSRFGGPPPTFQAVPALEEPHVPAHGHRLHLA